MPPLRERREDIPVLVEHFLERVRAEAAARAPRRRIAPEAMQVLIEYAWPGNVRELENVIERLVVTAPADVVTARRSAARGAGASAACRCGRSASAAARSPTISTSGWSRSGESFWTAVYPLYMQREITRGNVRDLVRKGLEEARGNYKIVREAVQHGAAATTSGS